MKLEAMLIDAYVLQNFWMQVVLHGVDIANVAFEWGQPHRVRVIGLSGTACVCPQQRHAWCVMYVTRVWLMCAVG